MKKRWLSILLVCGMLLTTLPSAVFAEGEEPSGCVCTTACTAEARNPECPTCGAEGAALEDCAKYEAKQENEPNDTQEPADPQEKAQEESKATEPAEEPTAPAKSQVAVQAAANNKAAAAQAAHTHCACGGSISAGGHTSHSNVTYTAWNGTSSITYTNNAAYVYLTGNATLSGHLTVDGKTLYLCLNGKTLSSNGSSKIQVKNGGHLVLCDCQGGGTFKGATKNVWGGACVYLYTSTFDMFGGKLTGGKVTKGAGGGGAIAMDDQQCVFNMYGGEISGNDGNNYGGAIFRKYDKNKPNITGGAFNMYGGTIKNNTALNGGAFFSTTGGTIKMTGGTISGNTATQNSKDAGGGVIYMRGYGKINISGSAELAGNTSRRDGGAILMGSGTITISGNAKLTGNTASRWGGAICLRKDWNSASTLNMTGGEISGNKANSEGGAVHVVDADCTFNLSGGKITGNTSKDGGAIYLNQEPSVLNMTGGEISGNTATGNGGGVYINRTGSVCNLSEGTISGNQAGGNGGGIYQNNGQLKLSGNPVVTGNTVSGKANNVYLPSGKKLTIDGAMSSGASVGVTTANTNYPVKFSEAYGENYETLFFADDTAKAHVKYNAKKKLQLAVHDFTVEKAEEQYLKSAASCTEKAVYYKSCACGARSDTETFEGDFAPHNFTAKTVDAEYLKSASSCTEPAVYYKSCKACGLSSKGTADEATFVSGNVLGHDWGEWTQNSDQKTHTRICKRDASHTETENCHGGTATCTAKAICEDCGGAYGDLVAHDFTAEVAEEKYLKSEATCTEAAVYYKSCKVCGLNSEGMADEATFVSGDVLAHDWGEPSYTWTSVADGYMCVASSKCKNCDTDIADVASMTYDVVTQPTCLTIGIGRHTATFSSFPSQTKDVTLPATGHDWGTAEYTWTSTEDGYNCTAKRVCQKDKSHEETETVTAAYAVVTEPTCLTAGLGRYQASFAADWAEDASKDVPLSALDHDWGAWTSNGNGTHTRVCARNDSHTENGTCSGGTATCTELATCVVCGGTYGQLAAHDFTAEVAEAKYLKTEATCTEQAVYYKSCKACGLASEDTFQSGNPLGHDYSTWKSNNDGTHTRVCANDSSHTENGTCSGGTATCTELATCAVCGGTYGQLAAHDFTAEVAEEDYLKSEATCTEAAVYYKFCTACGLTSEGTEQEDTFQYGNPLGHDYDTEWSQDETNHWHVCKRCQDIADLEEHTASSWITDKAATAKLDGEKHKECTVCGYLLETDTIPATGSKTKPGKKDNTKSDTKTRVKTNAPKTGDDSSLLLWTALLGVSGVGVTGVVLYGRKRKDNE